jgi:pimeloyl-ACP methyl ester carboxylesterase
MSFDWRAHDLSERHRVPSSDTPGLTLTLRGRGMGYPVLFVHGATFAGRIFDIPHPELNWLQVAADAGFAAYALDIRGYGLSKPAAFPDRPYATGDEAVADITDAVDWISTRHGGGPVVLVGWSWGSITTRRYAAGPGRDRVSALVQYAPIHAEVNEGWRDLLADPGDRGRLRALGAVRLVDMPDTRARWDAQLPPGAAWRSEAALEAIVGASIADDGDPTGTTFRVPNGTFVDLWECFNGREIQDPAAVTCPTLLVRGTADPTSTRSDALALFDRLGTGRKQYLEIADGSHFLNAEVHAPALFSAVHAFLGA